MGDTSPIEWLFDPYTGTQGATWNRWIGCERFSPACLNCYITRTPPMRIKRLKFSKAGIGGRTEIVMLSDAALYLPLRWKDPRMVFVESLGDLWHGTVPLERTAEMYAVMLLAPQHVFLTLTKRTRRMRNWLRNPRFATAVAEAITRIAVDGPVRLAGQTVRDALAACPRGKALQLPAHLWTGTTVENNTTAAERIPLLEDIDVGEGVRWLSCEPLTDEITDPLDLLPWLARPAQGQELFPSAGIDWVVFGGESGPAAKATALDTEPAVGLRPLDLDHLDRLLYQTQLTGPRVFVKQLGEPWARQHGAADRAGRDPQFWPKHLRVRDYPIQLAEHTLRRQPDHQLALQAVGR